MKNLILNEQLNCPIYFTDIFTELNLIHLCTDRVNNVVILTDDNVGNLYAGKLLEILRSNAVKAQVISIPAGEGSKTRAVKANIEDKMFSLGCGRDTLLLALGGGVITDLAGFVAATFCRGIPVVYLPTSLLAMVDAAIGGKTGINTPFGKNTIGTFTQPRAIFIDSNFLTSLPDIEYFGAVAEIIKHAVIYDLNYFEQVETNLTKLMTKDRQYLTDIIKTSCAIKLSIVAADEKELGQREILNFGHTIAHALESASDYKLSHGAAVAYGLLAESFISHKLGLLAQEEFNRIQQLVAEILGKLNLKLTMPVDSVVAALQFDKKNRNNLNRFVMLKKIGLIFYNDNSYAHLVDGALVQDAIDFVFNFATRVK